MNLQGKVALVTGAGSGIGKQTSLALARKGARLILCDVNEGSLNEVRSEVAGISECLLAERVDVSKADDMRAFAEKVHALVPAVDVLVNNAGVGLAGNFLENSLEDLNWVIGINLYGVIHGCHFFIPRMAESGRGGHVVNVSSLLGYWAGPDMSGYTATKHAVFGMSLCMMHDLRDKGIDFSIICPGIINTNIVSTARIKMADISEARRDTMNKFYVKRNLGPEAVAASIVSAIENKRLIVPVGWESWLMYYIIRISPALSRWLARVLTDKIKGN
jgi:NAD(P)-dependent dehydrogenase (short-subunit alcohol dehydrogenase family)